MIEPRFALVATRARRLALLLGLLVVVTLTSPVRAQTPRRFIWKVSKGAGSIYLVGSIHLLTEDYYPLPAVLDNAFKESSRLVEEVNLDEMLAPSAQMSLLSRGMLPANQSLDTVVSPATYALVVDRVMKLGMPLEPLKRFKPWSLAITLVEFEWQKAGFDEMLGLDRHFHDRAKVDGKAIQGLETVAFQISLFDDMTPDQQDHMLAESLKDIDTDQANLHQMTEAWKAGDAATIERLAIDELKREPDMYQRLLVARNQAWMPKLEALFSQPSPTFVVVGAAHLVGPDGLLAQLQAKGYHLEQL